MLKLKPDEEKLTHAKENKIKIIFIPFWWDRTLESLIATICENKEINFDFSEFIFLLGNNFDSNTLIPIPNEITLNLSKWRKRR